MNKVFKPRLRARQLNIRKRFMSITSKELVYIKICIFILQNYPIRSQNLDVYNANTTSLRAKMIKMAKIMDSNGVNMRFEPPILFPSHSVIN